MNGKVELMQVRQPANIRMVQPKATHKQPLNGAENVTHQYHVYCV